MRIALAQINLLVGAIEKNADRIIQESLRARDELHAQVIIFPELALTGYPPEDLLFRPALYDRVQAALQKISTQVHDITIIVGYPEIINSQCYNTAGVIQQGKIIATYHKQYLPNYSVFDEARYFSPGKQKQLIITVDNIPVAIMICEDLWHTQPLAHAKKAGAQLAICLNASPFSIDKHLLRSEILRKRIQENQIPIIYVNFVGGQDELIFDGDSRATDAQGALIYQAPLFKECIDTIVFTRDNKLTTTAVLPSPPIDEARIYEALVSGVQDYVTKNNFPGAIIGVSGGIDSALTLAIAVDALGKDRVKTYMLPSRFTSELSLQAAAQQAKMLGVSYEIISIEKILETFTDSLSASFTNKELDVTEENLQARIRGTLLMALSNKFGDIVLSTGNKSELSVGYSTLYGDMAGGFCVLKDVYKTLVYCLVHYRNQLSPVIPTAIIERPPTAELAFNQKDEDSLPPYPILDEILIRYIEQDQSSAVIIAAGFDEKIVKKVIQMIKRNEYKRRQAPIGVRLTECAFGRDRRYPITSGY